MAEGQDSGEKTEAPTAKRKEDARKKGDIPRSKELSTLAMTLGGALYLMFFGSTLIDELKTILQSGLSFDRKIAFELNALSGLLFNIATDAILAILPLLLLMLLIAVLTPGLLGGWVYTASAISPKLSKINPISGIKRMFSLKTLMELFKSTAKFILVSLFGFIFIYSLVDEILSLGVINYEASLSQAGTLATGIFVVASLALLIIAGIDVPYQLYEYNKKLKMSLQEIKDEYKQQEGNPEVKGRIRQVQREMSQKRMMQKVPEADVIITNPTHYAVAIAYNPKEMTQPIVVASGVDLIAMQIRNIAKEHHIPTIESPALARSLYANTEPEQPIPYGLFKAVASILAYTKQLDSDFDNKALKTFDNLEIPEELRFDR